MAVNKQKRFIQYFERNSYPSLVAQDVFKAGFHYLTCNICYQRSNLFMRENHNIQRIHIPRDNLLVFPLQMLSISNNKHHIKNQVTWANPPISSWIRYSKSSLSTGLILESQLRLCGGQFRCVKGVCLYPWSFLLLNCRLLWEFWAFQYR